MNLHEFIFPKLIKQNEKYKSSRHEQPVKNSNELNERKRSIKNHPMTDSINIGTWNLCLGLTNKKDYIKRKLIEEHLDILCVQECQVDPNMDENILTIRNHKIELENSVYKKRTAIYVHNRVNY